MTRITDPWLAKADTQRMLSVLESAGAQALLVGGCVRNALLGLPVGDIDVATDAPPDEVTAIAEKAGLRAVPTGIDHGTVTIIAGDTPFEVTTFRRDVETDGRRAVVTFAGSVEEDAARRDFTMNALYARRDGQVVDPLGGLSDLLARRVRFIGEPADRIREDYLRSLRYFRFHALYGDATVGFDPDALNGIAANLEGIDRLSRERIGAEMRKLLAAPDPAPSVATMRQTGLLPLCLPGADDTALAPLVHLEAERDMSPNAVRRLACLGGDNPKDALRLSRADNKVLKTLRNGLSELRGPAENAYRSGPDVARDIALLQSALFETPVASDLEEQIALGASAVFPLRAADLADELSGVELGTRLRELEQVWIKSGFSMDRSALMAL